VSGRGRRSGVSRNGAKAAHTRSTHEAPALFSGIANSGSCWVNRAFARTPTFVVSSTRPAAASDRAAYSSGPIGTSPALVIRSPSRMTPSVRASTPGNALAFADVYAAATTAAPALPSSLTAKSGPSDRLS
jgi:hypothetical protein